MFLHCKNSNSFCIGLVLVSGEFYLSHLTLCARMLGVLLPSVTILYMLLLPR